MLLHKVIEYALNKYFGLDPEARKELLQLNGKVIGIDTGIPMMEYYLMFNNEKIKVSKHAGTVDAKISGKPTAFVKFKLADSSNKLSQKGLNIEGDADVLQTFNDILESMDIDWEEYLSRWTGDVIAHGIAELLRGARNLTRSSSKVMQRNITDYLQEETQHLPTKREVETFYLDNENLTCDIDRLETRVTRLTEQKAEQ